MNARRGLRVWALAGATLACLVPARNVGQTAQDEELSVGEATFGELKARGEIIESSPLYDALLPVIEPIMQAARLVWLFQEFKDARTKEIPQLLSDHPNDQNRINALERHFRSDSTVFGQFDPNPQSAAPFDVPKKAPVVFMR